MIELTEVQLFIELWTLMIGDAREIHLSNVEEYDLNAIRKIAGYGSVELNIC
jgi:hypothetical protein